jgi:hypothetical protein
MHNRMEDLNRGQQGIVNLTRQNNRMSVSDRLIRIPFKLPIDGILF